MISACILTYNEEKNIQEVIDNVYSAVDEILIIDGFSTDKTLEIVEKNKKDNILVFQRKLDNNFGNQRNFAIQKARGDWIFMLDADEKCSDGLKAFLPRINEIKDYDGLTVLWKNYCDNNLVEVPRKLCIFKRHGVYQDALHEKVTGLNHVGNLSGEDRFLTHYKSKEEQAKHLTSYKKIILENIEKAKKTKDNGLLAYYEVALKRHVEKEMIWLGDYIK